MQFLVDSGSVLSILPRKAVSKCLHRQDLVLFAANASPIATYGQHNLTLNLGLRRALTWSFTIADVQTAILGADILAHYGILIDLRGRRILDSLTSLSSTGILGPAEVHSVTLAPTYQVPSQPQGEQYSRLVQSFTELAAPPSATATLPDLPVHHTIHTQGPPVFERPRRLSGERLAVAREEFAALLDRGIIRPSSSQWASPLHLVSKPGGGWRATGDYRRLNSCTTPDRYPLPIIEDLLQESQGKVFSVIDLRRAFHQVPVCEEDIPKTAVTTPFGLFEYVGMPFGLRNAAQTLQRLMNHLLRKLPYVKCYMDDLLVHSNSHEEHLQHLEKLFEALRDANLRINWAKCVFGASEVLFAGYHVNEQGYRPPAAKTKAISEFPKPHDTTQLRRFLGMVNFYRRCLPQAAAWQAPLNEMLKGATSKKSKLTWTKEADFAFTSCKENITKAASAAFLEPTSPLALRTDASSTAIGAALDQKVPDGTWTPIGFFSRKLSPTEQGYSAYDRELLAVYAAVKHFARILEGRPFTIYTDHRPLTYALGQRPDPTRPRRCRQLDYISQFNTSIAYTPGSENLVADALSRTCTISMPTVLDSATISKEQATDDQLPHLLTRYRVDLHKLDIDGHPLHCVLADNHVKPYIPVSLRRTAFDVTHRLCHPSGRATAKRLTEKYFWPGMTKDAHRWARQCQPCQVAKVHRHNRSELGNFTTPDHRFSHLHIDLIKLPYVQGFQYCLTVVDRYTRWPLAVPLPDMCAPTVARALYTQWISIFGTPLVITSDQGKQFESNLFAHLSKLMGAKHVHTTPYHPQSNGMVERMHRTLKAALMCHPETPWPEALPTVLLGLRTTFKEDLQASPAEMVFGTSPRVPGELFITDDSPMDQPEFVKSLRKLFRALRPVPAARHSEHKPFVFKTLEECTHVFYRIDAIRKPLEPPYSGPHRVIKRLDNRTYLIDINGQDKTVSTDNLKPAFLSTADCTPEPSTSTRQLHVVSSQPPVVPSQAHVAPSQAHVAPSQAPVVPSQPPVVPSQPEAPQEVPSLVQEPVATTQASTTPPSSVSQVPPILFPHPIPPATQIRKVSFSSSPTKLSGGGVTVAPRLHRRKTSVDSAP